MRSASLSFEEMSGLELLGILGVAANVGQLLDYSLRLVSSVSEVYSRVKDAPEMVLYYTAQISQLVETAREIFNIYGTGMCSKTE